MCVGVRSSRLLIAYVCHAAVCCTRPFIIVLCLVSSECDTSPKTHAQPRATRSSVLTIAQAQDAALVVLQMPMNEEQRRGVGTQWNLRSRAVAVVGAPCMHGFGRHVLPFLRRSVEGRAVHATSRELSVACRQGRWAREVQGNWGNMHIYGTCSLP